MLVTAKTAQSSAAPESHKVSVVLLECCSIPFICKCRNLSVNVGNTKERREKSQLWLGAQMRARWPCAHNYAPYLSV